MRVAWLADNPGYLGGAELTQAEFRAAAPKGVEVIEFPPGADLPDLDAAVVHNCMTYPQNALDGFSGPIYRYHNDVNHAPLDADLDATHIFCSPLQRERMGMEGECIPPAVDLDSFRHYASGNHRKGAVCIGRMAYGKGLHLLAEYPEPVDVYSSVSFASGGNARSKGPIQPSYVPQILARYERFVFLPTALEPFGRAVVEAWAAGLELVVNKNVGALHWITEHPTKLDSAGADFWEVVCG